MTAKGALSSTRGGSPGCARRSWIRPADHRRPPSSLVLKGYRYLLDDLLADIAAGHNIDATVFVQCGYAYRTDGPLELRPIGETERIAAIAEEAARRGGRSKINAAIVGYADLRLAKRLAAGASAGEKAALFRDNARRFYRLL